jgi:hypothetical protein
LSDGVVAFEPYRYYWGMGLIRKAIFLGAAATGQPLVRWNSSAEAAAKDQRRLMQEQNAILSQMADSDDEDFDDIPPEWCDENGIPLPAYFEARDEDFDDDYEPPEPSLTDKLTEIKALLDKGVISADEHAAMRKKILGV